MWAVSCCHSRFVARGSHDYPHPPLNEDPSTRSEKCRAIEFPDNDMQVWFPSIVMTVKQLSFLFEPCKLNYGGSEKITFDRKSTHTHVMFLVNSSSSSRTHFTCCLLQEASPSSSPSVFGMCLLLMVHNNLFIFSLPWDYWGRGQVLPFLVLGPNT